MATYHKITEQVVDISSDKKPLIKGSLPNISQAIGAVCFKNTVLGSIGWTTVNSYAGDFAELYIANVNITAIGFWVQLASNGKATTTFSATTQRNLGIVLNLANSNEPVLIQIAGEGYVKYTGTVSAGNFLGTGSGGSLVAVDGDLNAPFANAICGYALEDGGSTFSGLVKMRINIYG